MINSNSNLSQELRDVLKLQGATNRLTDQVGNIIQPVINVNPKHSKLINVIKTNAAANATSATIYTTPSDGQDFYLCGCSLSIIKDVTATSTVSAITVVLDDGVTSSLIVIAGFSLTVDAQTVHIDFNRPLKIKRGTAINVINGTNVANITARGGIWGYLEYNAQA